MAPIRLKCFLAVTVFSLLLLAPFTTILGYAQDSEKLTQSPIPSAAQVPQIEEERKIPGEFSGGADLPNGWRITPAGRVIGSMGDLVLNLVASPDGRTVISVNSGYLPHAVDVFDTKAQKQIQHISLPSTWAGMTWAGDSHRLFIAGGNASGPESKTNPIASVYEFHYTAGRLSDAPTGKFVETIDPRLVWWSGVAYLSRKQRLYAINRGTGTDSGDVVVFDTNTHEIVTRIPVEVTPAEAVISNDSKYLFVSNESSESVSVIDTNSNQVIRTLHVGINPNEMKLSADGRLFVACANDNTVYVIDTHALGVIERLSTTLTPLAPEGSTPDALAVDDTRKLLYIANADNNSIAVANIANRKHTQLMGFIPTGWYPSALALTEHGRTLYIGNAKGGSGHANPTGGVNTFGGRKPDRSKSIYEIQTSSLETLSVENLKAKLPGWTHQVMENTPYRDSLLSEARPPQTPSVIPQRMGVPTPIKHVIYIIKENRTYDQVFGDLPHANGDPDLAIFGEKITPNQHALAKQYVILDNLYCDGEVSVDGHSWSNSAYATDFNERQWPTQYRGRSIGAYDVPAMVPSSGHLWDLARRKGLTYRSYGENASRASTANGDVMSAAPGAEGLVGHVAADFPNGLAMRDTDKMKVFLRDLHDAEANFDNPNPNKRLPNYIVMSLPEDHTMGARPAWWTPEAMVADNDYAVGELVDAVSHSRYWPETAIFIIEDDAQDGPDHVDARRTAGLLISPYVKRGVTDSTLYSTSSMVRSIELLLGLPTMSQYDAAAMPMYASFGTTPTVTQFDAIKPLIDINAKNTSISFGAKASSKMDFSEPDRAPMHALNEIIWKSVRGGDSLMPPPVHRFRPLVDAGDSDDDDRGKKDKD